MKFTDTLAAAQKRNASLLCVGLDPEPAKFPAAWRNDAGRSHDFCAAIVDATKDLVCAFKPQIAYFAAQRAEDQLERLMAHIRRVAGPGRRELRRFRVEAHAQQRTVRGLRGQQLGAEVGHQRHRRASDSARPV